MNLIQKGFKYLTDTDYRFMIASQTDKYNQMPDDEYLRRLFKAIMGRELNLESPKCLNDKFQWLKLYYKNPLYTKLADKYEAKAYIREKIGKKYVVPTLGVWERFDDINFSILPNAFALKCTHNSGGNVLVRDKKKLDIKVAKVKIDRCMQKNYFFSGREWVYKDIKPRIIAEPLIENSDHSRLVEYKYLCFNGKPTIITRLWGDNDKGEQRFADYFQLNGERYPFSWGYPTSDAVLETGKVFEDMSEKAQLLSEGMPFARVDFYVKDGQALVGEITFYDGSGLEKFYPEQWDEKIGELLELPEKGNLV